MNESFWNYHELAQLHIELTNACNAACPSCVRFYLNSPNTRPDLEIGQITLKKFIKYFPPEVIKKCDLILFCGVHGDPCVARDTYEICEYIASISKKTAVRMNTNGGMRKSHWWQKLGKLFADHRREQKHWEITFSIDGLEDTNHLYRRNVNWQRLMENVNAFIGAGGAASWDYLIFKHNEHQIQDALELSKKLGFVEFVPKKALGVDNGTELIKMPAMTKDGKLDYVIEAPTLAKNRNLENPKGEKPVQFYPFTYDNYRILKSNSTLVDHFQTEVKNVYRDRIRWQDNSSLDKCIISCKSRRYDGKKEVFVDNFGRVMPCCYIGTHLNGLYSDTKTLQLHKHMNDYGWEHFSLESHSLEQILQSGHLDRVFADSWDKESIEKGKLSYCADTCGKLSSIDKIFSHELNNRYKNMFEMSKNFKNE